MGTLISASVVPRCRFKHTQTSHVHTTKLKHACTNTHRDTNTHAKWTQWVNCFDTLLIPGGKFGTIGTATSTSRAVLPNLIKVCPHHYCQTLTQKVEVWMHTFFLDLVECSVLVLVSKICHYGNDHYYYYYWPVIWSTNRQGKSTHQSHVSCLKRSSYVRSVWIFNVLKVNIYIMFRVNPINCARAPLKDCLICFSNEN